MIQQLNQVSMLCTDIFNKIKVTEQQVYMNNNIKFTKRDHVLVDNLHGPDYTN